MSEALAIPDDAALFDDPDFAEAIQKRTKHRAKAAFHGRGMDRLVEMAGSEDDRTALSAITLLGKLAGEFKAPRPVVLNFSDLMDKKQAIGAGPLGGITDIREAQIVGENEGVHDDTSDD